MTAESSVHVPLNGGQPSPSRVNVPFVSKRAVKNPKVSGVDGRVTDGWRALTAQSPKAKHVRKPATRTAQTRRRPPDITYTLAILRHDAGSCASDYFYVAGRRQAPCVRSFLSSSTLAFHCGPPNDGLRSSRGSGYAPWVRDPALAFYPGTRGSRGPRRLCSLRSRHRAATPSPARSRGATQ